MLNLQSLLQSSDIKRPVCLLCKQAGCTNIHHFLSKCKFLPSEDKAYMTKVRPVSGSQDYDSDRENDEVENQNVGDSSHIHITYV